MLTQKDLFAKALLVEKPWFVQEINFDQTAGNLEIWIDFERGSAFYCEDQELGIKGYFKAYDTTEKTWRYLNFSSISVTFMPGYPGLIWAMGRSVRFRLPGKAIHRGSHCFLKP